MHSAFPRDRYSPHSLLEAFYSAEIRSSGTVAAVTLTIADLELDLEFPDRRDAGTLLSTDIVFVLAQISRLDNLVQESCEVEFRRSHFGPENFELYLAHVTLSESGLILGYYGSKVNTEWDARFHWLGDNWEPENFSGAVV